MEGKRLFYAKKMCDATNCANHHTSKIEQIENHIISLFDSQLTNNNIIFVEPKQITYATHIQCLDKDGRLYVLPRGIDINTVYGIVNFRPIIISPNITASSLNRVNIGGLLEAYERHLEKPF